MLIIKLYYSLSCLSCCLFLLPKTGQPSTTTTVTTATTPSTTTEYFPCQELSGMDTPAIIPTDHIELFTTTNEQEFDADLLR